MDALLMKEQLQATCEAHDKFESFKCYSCRAFLCPECLESHPCRKGLVRAEVTAHFLTYKDDHYQSLVEREEIKEANKNKHEIMLWMYDVSTKDLKTQSFVGTVMDYESIYIQHRVYLIGGLNYMPSGAEEKAFKAVVEYSTRELKFRRKADMLTPKYASTVCTTDERSIFTVGGKNRAGYLAVCEKYSIAENTWKLLKPLHTARAHPSLGVYNCSVVYCVGGYNKLFVDAIEALDTRLEDNEWSVIKMVSTADSFCPGNGMAIVQNPLTNALMIFGGCGRYGLSQNVFELDVEKRAVEKAAGLRLKKAAAFIERKAVLWNDCYYLVEYGCRAGIYKYSFRENVVERIKASSYILDEDLLDSKIKKKGFT